MVLLMSEDMNVVMGGSLAFLCAASAAAAGGRNQKHP